MNIRDFDLDIDAMADEMTEEEASLASGDPSQALLPRDAIKARLRAQIVESLNNTFLRLANGMKYLLTRLQQMTEGDAPVLDKLVFDSIVSKLSEKRGEDLTPNERTALHASAVEIYNSKEYDQAADAFFALTEIFPNDAIFWKALGNAKFHIGAFQEAFDAYTVAVLLNEKDVESMIYQARSLEALNRSDEALTILYSANELIGNDPQQVDSWSEGIAEGIQRLKNS